VLAGNATIIPTTQYEVKKYGNFSKRWRICIYSKRKRTQ
jgi:hypothetical protein